MAPRAAPAADLGACPELVDSPAALDQGQRASVTAAHEQLVSALRELQQRYPQQGELLLTGHAHIDLAWLWPYSETRRKMRRTFHTAAGLMEASDDYRFNQSTAQYYAQMEEDDPALLQQIKARVANGQWEVIGGMWVEPDTNMPTGESLTRQILSASAISKSISASATPCAGCPTASAFPAPCRSCSDRAASTASLPSRSTGPRRTAFQKTSSGGRDSTARASSPTPSTIPMAATMASCSPTPTSRTWRNFKSKALHSTSLFAIGYGDGGGGTTPEMVEREVQLRDFPVLPRARWGHVADYFAAAHKRSEEVKLPVWSGEIYLELHRATLTTQSGVKRLHRQAERALITAETAASLAHMLGAAAPPSLEPQWRVVLKNEFHDILPGSSIREVVPGCRERAGRGNRRGQGIAVGGARRDGGAIAERCRRWAARGQSVIVGPPDRRRCGHGPAARAWRSSVAICRPWPHSRSARLISRTAFSASRSMLTARSAALVHKPTGREALAGAGNQLWAYPFDRPRSWDAWDVDEDYAEKGEQLTAVESIEIVESGPARAAVKVVRKFRASTITQTYVLLANSPRLDIETSLDWHDRRVFLRTLTPVAARNERATFECANGVVRRPTHQNTSWDQAMFEAAAHRFIDLSEPGFGVALLNNAKYGHNVKGNVLGMSLVRSPIYPDPLADEGLQSFAYAPLPA